MSLLKNLKETLTKLLREDPQMAILLTEILGTPVGLRASGRPDEAGGED